MKAQLLLRPAFMNVGAELARARQKLGLTLEGLSSKTKISVERLCAIEEMDAPRLPSLIYLKGFLRAYAAEVQLDPEILTERYLSQLDVVGGLDIIARPQASRPPASESDARTSHVRSDALPPEILEFASESTVRVPNPRAPQRRMFELDDVPHDDAPDLDILDLPLDQGTRAPSGRSRAWRRSAAMLLVLPLAAIVGWLLGENYDAIAKNYGGTIEQNYGAIMARVAQVRELVPFAQDEPARSTQGHPVDAGAAQDLRRAPRREASAADAGVGTERPAQPGDKRAATADDGTRRTGPPREAALGEIGEPPAETAREDRGRQAVRADDDRPADAAHAVAQDRRNTGEGLSGWWALTNRVESSSYAPNNGMNVGYHLQLRQVGDHVSGTGQKWMENGRALMPDQRTPITVEGTIDGKRLHLGFTERGASRASAGTVTLALTDADTLSGTFESDTEGSQGTSLARRVQPPQR